MNISNIYSATFLVKEGFDVITPSYDMSITDIENMSRYVNVEIVEDYITVMTSRYCILGSFVANRNKDSICFAPCTAKGYYIEDTYGERYDIVCNNIDCVMKILKQHKLEKEGLNKKLSHIRNNII